MTERIRLDDLTSDQLDQMYDELDQLRAGEEDGWDERVVPTPGQWIWKWNRATPETRLQVIAAFMRQAGIAERCELEDHAGAVEENRHAWQIIGRIRALRDDWLLMTLEPGQVRRLLDGITRALDEPAAATATQATDEPATVTDPAYLRQQYAAAIRDTPARYPDDIATAVMRVRDRHVEQLRQRLELAALQPQPLRNEDGQIICTCGYGTPCGCGTSIHYDQPKGD